MVKSGVDGGGLRREIFHLFFEQLHMSDVGFFEPREDGVFGELEAPLPAYAVAKRPKDSKGADYSVSDWYGFRWCFWGRWGDVIFQLEAILKWSQHYTKRICAQCNCLARRIARLICSLESGLRGHYGTGLRGSQRDQDEDQTP